MCHTPSNPACRARRRGVAAPFTVIVTLALALAGIPCAYAQGIITTIAGGGGGSNSAPASNPGTPAGNYTLTVTGTTGSGSAALSHTVTLTLTVN